MQKTSPLVLTIIVLLLVWSSSVVATPNKNNDDVITVVAGDYSEGQITLYNPMKATYTRAILRQISVYDSKGRLVDDVNVTLTPRVVDNWKGLSPLRFQYLVNCSRLVSPGNYTVTLKFIGVLSDGDVNVFRLSIPLRVLGSPIVVRSIEVYPNDSVVFLNDTLIGYVHVLNIGHKNVSANFSVVVEKGGAVYYSSFLKVELHPGESRVEIEIPITQKFDESSYDVVFRVESKYGVQLIKKRIVVSVGVEVYSVSLERKAVYPSDELNLYVTLLSSRNALVSMSVKVYKNGTLTWSHLENVSLEPGVQVVNIKLPTEEPGSYTAGVAVNAFNVDVGEDTVSYTVWSLPTIGKVVPSIRDGILLFNVQIHNTGPKKSGILKYTVTLDNRLFYSGSKVIEVLPGNFNVSLKFPLSISSGGNLTYAFILDIGGHTSGYTGEYTILIPKPTESTTTSTSTTSSSSNNETAQSSSTPSGGASPDESGINTGVLVLAVVLLLMVVGLWLFETKTRKAKKRSRPKPKRRSPLGRFKRPKPPKFKRFDSIPKKR